MGIAGDKVRMMLVKKNRTRLWLAHELRWSPSTLNRKLRIGTLTENEMQAIADELNYDLEINFISKIDGEKF